jgi:hypothetical protein
MSADDGAEDDFEDEAPDDDDFEEFEDEFEDLGDDVDVEDDDEGERRPGHPAAYASNWKTVLVVDGLVGVVLLIAGIVLSIAWNPVVGGFIGACGLVYVAFIAKRAQQWRGWREDAGL